MIKNEDGSIVPYHEENHNQRYIDGSFSSDLPLQRMSELFNVNTFIVSQVNPHVAPFLSGDGGGILEDRLHKRFVRVLKGLAANQLNHVFTQLETAGMLPSIFKQTKVLMTQVYKGHVTIAPQVQFQDYLNILKNLDQREYEEGLEISYLCTIKKISLIKAVFGIEREFDRYYLRLKQMLQGSPAKFHLDYHIIDYMVARTLNKEVVWEEEDHSFEELEKQHNELICFIS